MMNNNKNKNTNENITAAEWNTFLKVRDALFTHGNIETETETETNSNRDSDEEYHDYLEDLHKLAEICNNHIKELGILNNAGKKSITLEEYCHRRMNPNMEIKSKVYRDIYKVDNVITPVTFFGFTGLSPSSASVKVVENNLSQNGRKEVKSFMAGDFSLGHKLYSLNRENFGGMSLESIYHYLSKGAKIDVETMKSLELNGVTKDMLNIGEGAISVLIK